MGTKVSWAKINKSPTLRGMVKGRQPKQLFLLFSVVLFQPFSHFQQQYSALCDVAPKPCTSFGERRKPKMSNLGGLFRNAIRSNFSIRKFGECGNVLRLLYFQSPRQFSTESDQQQPQEPPTDPVLKSSTAGTEILVSVNLALVFYFSSFTLSC